MNSLEATPAAVSGENPAPSPTRESHPGAQPSSRRIRWAQAVVLVAMYSLPIVLCLRLAAVDDPDVWWHLRSGEWIMQHGAVPQTEPFSSFGAGKPWVAYSWFFEVLIVQLFHRLGLIGIMAYTIGMVTAVTIALHHLIRRLQVDFTLGVFLTSAASFGILRLYTPRPWLFTILLFVLELDVLMQARKMGRTKELLWLPVLFALWANVHIQFVYGLAVLAIALAETVLARRWNGIQTRLHVGWAGGIFIACVLATLANPYGWRIYGVVCDLAEQFGVLNDISEFKPLPFRRPDDWCVLLLALAAVVVLARARRFALFEVALLAFGFYVSFRAQRDVWVVVIAASAILAGGLMGDEKNSFQLTASAVPFVAIATGLVALLVCFVLHVDDAHLRAKLAGELPVRAVEVVKKNGWSGPLYNDFSWGGYLIWALRMPVSVDGRTNVYGDELIERSVATWNGQPDWASDSNLQKAKLVIGPVKAPLTQLLRMDPRFGLVYEDKLAAVFVERKVLLSAPGTAALTVVK
jgi:hypothetical protein